MTPEQEKARKALAVVIPLLEKFGFRWAITGGFACYAYGLSRPLTDIDIDIEIGKDMDAFKEFMESLGGYITQPLEHFVDENYDNYNFEATIEGVVVDICPMAEMNVFNKETSAYENFYKNGFPAVDVADFFGLKLPLLAKELIIKNKEMLVFQRDSDRADIEGLRRLLAA